MLQALGFCAFALLLSSASAVKDRFYPRYHLAPPHGWMNDPNGFCVYKNEYHLFYQYNPESSLEPGIAHWGHAKSKDLFNWEHLPIAMYPDQPFDKTGVFSGSAIVEDDVMYLFYTGNVNHPGELLYRIERQALAISTDGVNVVKYPGNPVLMAQEHQPNIRDPKVWKHDDTYYMVLGNSFNNDTLGRVLLYASQDKLQWEQVSIIGESDGFLGYMWECPDFFEMNGRFVFLFSPQGVEPEGDKYRTLYQTGYIVGDFDYGTNKFTPLTEFKELDHGHDFYAIQTIQDNKGRRLLVAWLDMWEQKYPEQQDGFTGQMTIPRELILTEDNILIQKPVEEIALSFKKVLHKGKPQKDTTVVLEDNAGEIVVNAKANQDLEILLESCETNVKISYDAKQGKVTLDRDGTDDFRRTEWRPKGSDLHMRIFVDASSIEVFCGEGEVTFSSRFFPDGEVSVRVGETSKVDNLRVTSIRRTTPLPDSDR